MNDHDDTNNLFDKITNKLTNLSKPVVKKVGSVL